MLMAPAISSGKSRPRYMSASGNPADFPARIGLGTWEMGVLAAHRGRETAAVKHALDVGYRLLDSAEMYADGGAERVIGGALRAFGAARRAQIYIVSKVLPGNASRRGTVRACEASIERMGCDYLDLYLLHWPGRHEFSETLRGFDDLMQRGLIRAFGVSNLDTDELRRWLQAQDSLGLAAKTHCNQLYYCAEARGIEFQLLPYQREHGIATMAYSPLGRGSLVRHPLLVQLGRARGVSAAQIALAWCLREPDVIAIPKSVDPTRIEENLAAAQLRLTAAELAQIDQAFPPPKSKQPLDMV
jgi:diketogulonate reductase-like aldo/keto reductase